MSESVQVKLRLDPDLVAWLHEYAEVHDRNLSYVVGAALRQKMDKVERDRKRRAINSGRVYLSPSERIERSGLAERERTEGDQGPAAGFLPFGD